MQVYLQVATKCYPVSLSGYGFNNISLKHERFRETYISWSSYIDAFLVLYIGNNCVTVIVAAGYPVGYSG